MKTQFGKMALLVALTGALAGCGDDDDEITPAPDAGNDASTMDDAGPMEDASVDLVPRGQYLVETVAVCVDCHSPRLETGAFDPARALSGVDCFIDAVPGDDAVGCLNSANLTNHATGLANRSDEEIKAMFLTGVRPGGEALHPFMPYWSYGNMSDEDADAIVAYLRTVPGVDHMVSPNQAPFDNVPAAAPRVDLAMVPTPDAADPNYESALRGRYLAAQAGVCLECHTEDGTDGQPRNLAKAFQGGRVFPAALLGLPTPPFPENIVSRNLTPHTTGLDGWTAEQIVTALQQGTDPDGMLICPPMPSGPMGAFHNLTNDDALDIAHFLLSLPAADNDTGPNCALPAQ